jgi:hypothetical protein
MKYLKKLIWIVLCIGSGLSMAAGLFQFLIPKGDNGLGLMLVMVAVISGFYLRPEKPRRAVE